MTRSKPFSGKQKKEQLKAKKDRKRAEDAIDEEKLGSMSLHDRRKLAQKIIDNRVAKKSALHHSKNDSDDDEEISHEESRDDEDEDHSSSYGYYTTDDDDDEDDEDEEDDGEENNDKNNIRGGGAGISTKSIKQLSEQLKTRDIEKIRSRGKVRTRTSLVTIFEKESRDEIERRKDIGKQPLDTRFRERPWEILDEHRFDDRAEDDNYIDIPKRPKWDFGMSAEREKEQERIMFKQWLDGIAKKYDTSRLNYFEHNLEVWRQLWRVCERSDIVLLVTDARYPLFHFPPALYHYIKDQLKKPMLLVLNKVDLVDRRIVDAWVEYFTTNYSWVKIICFSSFRPLNSAHDHDMDVSKRRKFKKGRKNYSLAGGKKQLVEAILSFNIIKKDLNINDIVDSLKNNFNDDDDDDDEDDGDDNDEDDQTNDHSEDDEDDEDDEDSNQENQDKEQDNRDDDKPKENCITVGTVGHPNVGKSSLINGLMGKKVVSTSRTPGHTKHFQTIFLTKDIVLCDCPGLVFPALDRPKSLQVLCGLYPIAQVREPYSAIRYLADRVPIEQVYGLKHPDLEDGDDGRPHPWSPYTICEAFAYKRGYLVAKSGRADVHRAGLEILRDCVDGNIVISWPPPSFTKEKYQEIMSIKHTDYLKEKDENDNQKNNNNNQLNNNQNNNIVERVKSTRSERKQDKKTKQKKKLENIILNDRDSDYDDDDNQKDDDEDDEEEYVRRKGLGTGLGTGGSGGTKNKVKKTTITSIPLPLPQQSIPSKVKGKKKLNAKSLDYAERLAEKQSKGGNQRQSLI